MSPLALAGLAAAGAAGASCRYLLDQAIGRRAGGVFPWGTLVVNVAGSLLLGLLTGAALHRAIPVTAVAWLGTGFCGAFTTYSTFAFETVRLVEEGTAGTALANVAANVVAGAAAAAVGLAVMS